MGENERTSTYPISTVGLEGLKQAMQKTFPDWDISYRLIVDGNSWGIPRSAVWTGTRNDTRLTGDTASELRKLILRHRYQEQLRNPYRDTPEPVDVPPEP